MKKKMIAMLLMMVCSLSSYAPTYAEETTTPPDTNEIQLIENSIITPQTADVGRINSDGVRLRQSAGTSGTILALLYTGDSIAISTTKKTVDGVLWRLVEVDRLGISGWVADQYITFSAV